MSPWRLYFSLLRISIKSQMQYKISMILQIMGMFGITAIEFLGLWSLFQRFNSLAGWNLAEIALFYGIVNIIFALTEAVSFGFAKFAAQVKSGDFDRILLRPRSTILQVSGQELTLRRIGRFSQGIAVMIWSLISLETVLQLQHLLLLLITIVSGILVFMALFIIQAALSFWTVETLEIMNSLTYGGVYTCQHPLSIYKSFMQKFFLFIVPLGCISYLPICSFLNRSPFPNIPSWIGWLSPISGVLFFSLAVLFWRYGIKHYTSTGS